MTRSKARCGNSEAAARGVMAAQKAIRAAADGDDTQVLAVLNALPFEDSLWCSSALLGCLRQMALVLAGGDPKEAGRLLHLGADGMDEDVAVTQAEVIVAEAFNRDGGLT